MSKHESMDVEQFRALVAKGAAKQHGRRQQHISGEMNKTESRMGAELDLQLKAGEILWWRFESVSLKIAKRTWIRVDFLILHADGTLELRDTKGHVEDDYLVKMKTAAEMFPMFLFTEYKPNGRGWKVRVFG